MINVFEKAVLDVRAEGLNVDLQSMGWHLFEKGNLTLERQERLLGASEDEYAFAAIRGALIKLFPDSIMCQERGSPPERQTYHASDWKPNDRPRNRFHKRDGRTGRYTAHETDPNSQEEESCVEESDLTTAVEELEDTLDLQDSEDLREPGVHVHVRGIGHRERNARQVEGENEEPRSPASLVSLFFTQLLVQERHPRAALAAGMARRDQ